MYPPLTLGERSIVPATSDERWLARFYAGERSVLEQCYRDYFARALAAAARVLPGVDAETVTHEIFYRLLSDEQTRRSFGGGSFGAWVAQAAANAAIDHHRRRSREIGEPEVDPTEANGPRFDDEVEAKVLVERFCRERLPPKYKGVFETRFLRQLSQRDAARELGIRRSTLAYQEDRIRALLSEFLLDTEEP